MADYRKAMKKDLEALKDLDRHISIEEIQIKIDREEYVVLVEDENVIGFIRYGYFWDEYPFMNLLWIIDSHRGKGFGREMVLKWEEDMKSKGFRVMMTSTQSDEYAQHFYRKLGYKDIGGFTFPGEPLELMMIKEVMVIE